MRDVNGHFFSRDSSLDEHPFLTAWKCTHCGRFTTTSDGSMERPQLPGKCSKAPPGIQVELRSFTGSWIEAEVDVEGEPPQAIVYRERVFLAEPRTTETPSHLVYREVATRVVG